jgi:hypothetical protein
MKRVLFATLVVLSLGISLNAQAKDDSLFPKPDEVKNDKPTLGSAIAQFEGIIKDSTAGQMSSVQSNGQYNQTRAGELGKLLAEKRKYLESIPGIVSSQFEDLMRQFAGSDQKTRNKMADELYARWQAKEAQVKQEIKDLEEQLGTTTGRLSDLAVEKQMLDVSNALSDSENALRQKQASDKVDLNAESPAYVSFTQLASQHAISRIQGFCPIQIKGLEDELSVGYIDN